MSVVYLARKHDRQGVVALKLISPELTADPTYRDMFVDETDIASRIRHPNVCAVHDFDRSGSDCYIAMEYIVGEPASAMRNKLAKRNAAVDRDARLVARFLSDVCEGLHAAHELCNDDGEPLNVVHRDISPENLFLSYEGVAKIVDFGLVNSATQHHRTRTGLLKGKFAYIAPEILNGKRPDRRADVWGLGLVAWELLTGRRLFRRSTEVETLRAVIEGIIPPPSEVRAGIPKALDVIVLRALERKPKDRYATALELGKDLLRVSASGEEIISAGDLVLRVLSSFRFCSPAWTRNTGGGIGRRPRGARSPQQGFSQRVRSAEPRGARDALAREFGRRRPPGTNFGHAALARWMDDLFPAGAERRRNLIELAMKFDASETESSPPRLERNSPSAFPPAAEDLSTMATIALDRSTHDRASSYSTPHSVVRDVATLPPRSSSRWALFAALGVGCLVGTLVSHGISWIAKPAKAATARTALESPRLPPGNDSVEEPVAVSTPALASMPPAPAATAVVPGSFVVSGPVVIEIAGDPPVLSIRPR